VRYWAILALCLFVATRLQAQTPDPTPLDAPQPGVRPPLSPFPRYEDWSFLRDPSLRVDPYDRLKFIPLNESGTNYLTFGLESRTEFQYLGNNNWGAGPENPGVVLVRLMPDIDLRLGDHARVFVTPFFHEFTGHIRDRKSTKILPMDTKDSSSSGATCTIRTPVGMSLPGGKKSCSGQADL
jgi:hypothetical protein